MANFNFSLGFDVEKQGIIKAKQELAQLKSELQNKPAKFNVEVGNLQQSLQQISVFENALTKAFNPNLNKLDMREFMKQLHSAGYSLEGLKRSFSDMGVDATRSMRSIENGLQSTNLSLKKTNKMVESMAETFTNTLKWNVASQAIHGIEGSVGRAIGFIKDLDNSLNNIRIVTGQSKDQMDVFAQGANRAAGALGKTTVEYTDASLIYFQQGKSASEVRKLTEATLIGSSITGEGVSETAELLTAALNGFNLQANKSMDIMDKFAAVGAGTGSDFNELAIGFSKVASMASIAGVSVDQLNGMLATTSTVTREAPESIGTSFKTIFGRMTEMKAGKKDEDGWEIGKVNKVIEQAGFKMTDKNGALKDTGAMVEEIGDKWKTFNKETQLALSTAMAGSRQQNRLIALYNNWDMYKEALQLSKDAAGTAYEQNIIRMDSLEYKAKTLKAAMEEMWMKMLNSEAMSGMIVFFTNMTNGVNDFIDALGGIGPILILIAAAMTKLMSNKLSSGAVGFVSGITDGFKAKKRDDALMANQADSNMSDAERKKTERLQAQYKIRKYLTEEQHKEYMELQKVVETEERKLDIMNENIAKAKAFRGDTETTKGSDTAMARKSQENARDIASSKIAFKELTALKENTGQRIKISQATIVATGQTEAQLRLLVGQGPVLDGLIEQSAARRIEAEKENEAIKRNQQYLSENYALQRQQQEEDTQVTHDTEGSQMNQLEGQADTVGKVQNVIDGAMAATVAIAGVTSAIKAFGEAGKDSAAQVDALAAGAASVGASLMMTGNPYAMAVGGAIELATVIGKVVWENTGLRKVMKDNKEIIDQTTESISNAKTQLQNLGTATQTFKDLQVFMKDGKVNLNDLGEEDLAKYYEMANKLAELTPSMVSYYDDQGNAVIDLTTNLTKLKDAQKEEIRKANETKTGNVEGFAAEAGSKIDLSQDTITKNKEALDAMGGGQAALDAYNIKDQTIDANGMATGGTSYVMEDMSKLSAEVQAEQAALQEVGVEIQNNIVAPLFSGSKAFKNMTDEQQTMARALLTTGKATAMVHNPEQLKAYTNEIKNVMDKMGEEKVLSDKITENKKELNKLSNQTGLSSQDQARMALLEKENSEYDKQIKKVKELSAAFEKLGTFKQESLLSNLATLGLEGEEQDAALSKMTDYYAKNDVMAQGPMTAQDLRGAAGQEKGSSVSDYSGEMIANNSLVDATASAVDANGQEQTKVREQLGQFNLNSETPMSDEDNAKYAALTEQLVALKGAEDDLVQTQSDFSDAAIIAGIAVNDETKANAELEGQYWNQIIALAATTEGYNQLADTYNSNLVAMEALGQAADANLNKGGMDEVANSLDVYKDKIPGLSDALEDYRKNGESSFDGLSKFAIQAQEEMQQSNGRINAAMKADDGAYYQSFLKINQAATDSVYVQYGIRAADYTTYGEYEKAVNKAKEGNKLSITQQKNNQATLDNQLKSKNEAALNKGDVNNTGKAAKDKVTIWSTMTNSGLSAADKWAIGWRLVVDGVTKLFSSMANAVIDVWNGMLGAIESGVNAAANGINKLVAKLPTKVKEFMGVTGGAVGTVSLGRANHTSGTNLAGAYIATTQKTTPEFNYSTSDMPTAPIEHQSGGGTPGGTPTAPGTKGPGVGSGGGAGDKGKGGSGDKAGDKDKEAKVQEDMALPENLALHDTNVLLQIQDDLLKDLKEKEGTLYGLAKMANLDAQNVALAKKKDILQQQLVILRAQALEERNALKAKGATFNEDGTISNYVAIIKAKVAAANAIKDADAKKAAQDEAKKFIDALKAYEDLQLKVTLDKEQAIDDVEKIQDEIKMKQFEYKITVQLELSKDQDDMMKFLKDVNNEFKGISETYDATFKQLGGKLGEIDAIQTHINETLADGSLTDKERIETLDKYEKLMQAAVVDAKKLQEELVKLNAEGLKGGLDLLDKQMNKYETIGKTLDHIANMIKLTGNQKNFGAIDKVFEAQESALKGQLNGLMKGRDLLKDMLATQVEGSDEWNATNEQLVKMDSQIQKITEETLKTFQEEFNNSFTEIMDKLDKAMSGGMGMSELKSNWSEMKADGDKYLSTQEKIIWAGNMQFKLQQQIDKTTNPATKKKLLEFQNIELANLKKKDILTKYDVDRSQKMYNITQAQILLDEARNNKTIQRLVRDSSGNWSYQYVEDSKKVADAQENLSSALQDLMDFDKKAFLANQDEMLAAKEKFAKDMQEIMKNAQNGEYADEAAFNLALAGAQATFDETTLLLQTENDSIRQNVSESTMAAILATYVQNKGDLDTLTADQKALLEGLGTSVDTSWQSIREALALKNQGSAEDYKTLFTDIVLGHSTGMTTQLSDMYASISGAWDASTGTMGDSNDILGASQLTLASVVSGAIEEIKTKWTEYQDKVDKAALAVGEDMGGLETKTGDLKDETTDLGVETNKVILKIGEEWKALSDLIKEYQKIDGSQYDDIIDAAIDYIKNLDEILRKQKEVATGVTTPKVTPPVVKPPVVTPPKVVHPTPAEIAAANAAAAAKAKSDAAAALAKKNASLKKGGAVRVKSGRTWYYDSEGMNPSGPTTPYANTQLYITNTANGQYAVGKSTNINSSLGWLKKTDLVGFRSGGYTGNFGNDGKAAILHEKELVLNKADTSNILEVVKIVRDYASMIRQIIGAGANAVVKGAGGDIQQTVQINADFSGVKSSFEIEKAFANLGNRATQFAQRK